MGWCLKLLRLPSHRGISQFMFFPSSKSGICWFFRFWNWALSTPGVSYQISYPNGNLVDSFTSRRLIPMAHVAVGETELIALVVAGPQPCEKETDRSARVQFIFPQNRVCLMSYTAIPSILWSFLEVMIKPFILDDHRTIPACGGCSHPPVGAALVVINSWTTTRSKGDFKRLPLEPISQATLLGFNQDREKSTLCTTIEEKYGSSKHHLTMDWRAKPTEDPSWALGRRGRNLPEFTIPEQATGQAEQFAHTNSWRFWKKNGTHQIIQN